MRYPRPRLGRPISFSGRSLGKNFVAQTNVWSHLATMRPAVSSTDVLKKKKKNGSVDRDFNVVVCLFVCFSTRTTQMHTLDVTKFDRQRCCVCTEKNLKKAKIADFL